MRISDLTPREIRNYFEQRLGCQFRGDGVKQIARCCFHQDSKPSLSVDFAKGVWHCFTGCGAGGLIDFEVKFSGGISRTQALAAIFEAVGVEHDIQAVPDEEPEAIYPYTDEMDRLLFQKLRYPGKRFTQRKLGEDGRWVYQLGKVRKPLYRLPYVVTANQVIVCEGEKDADNVNALRMSRLDESGFSRVCATTNFDGAGHWDPALSRYFAGKAVAILPDFDDAGSRHAQQVAASVHDFAESVRVVQLPGLPPKGDVSDYLATHSAAELAAEIGRAALWAPTRSALLVPAWEFMRQVSEEIDWLVEGVIQRGANGFVASDPKTGKAQPLDAKIATPTGWKYMGNIRVGDEVFGSQGIPTRVLQIHPQGRTQCYMVKFSDGTSVETTGGHIWTLQSHNDRVRKQGWRDITTQELYLREASPNNREFHLPMISPVQYPDQSLPLPPYILGVLLGDGCMTRNETFFTSCDPHIVRRVESELPVGLKISRRKDKRNFGIISDANSLFHFSCVETLHSLGLAQRKSSTKFIPKNYLVGSLRQRVALLQGLLDTDGWIGKKSGIEFMTVSPLLADTVQELVESLGGTVSTTTKKCSYVSKSKGRVACQDGYRLRVKLPREIGCPFSLPRKAARWWKNKTGVKKPPTRRIVGVERSREVECQCISVSASDGLYATEHYILTHNSWIAVDLALALATATPWMGMTVRAKVSVALITREDNPNLTKWRMKRLLAGRDLTEGDLDERLYVNSRDQSPVFKLDVPEQLSEMMAALKQFRPEFIILDVLNVLHSSDENDNTEMRKILDHAQLMSEETRAGVCVLHHFNKDAKNGRLTQRIRGAGAIAGWAEFVIGLHRQNDESEDSLRWAEFELKAGASPSKVHFRIQSDELAPRTTIVCEDAPVKASRKRGGLA